MPSQGGLNLLSDADVALLREMVRGYKSQRISSPYRQDDLSTHQAPETYVALPIPCEGIPGLIREETTGTGTFGDESGSTGTDSDTGTGSGTTGCPGDIAGPGDRPGMAMCDIYRLNQSNNTLQKLGITKPVYNLSASPLPKDWTLVTRDKSGRWYAVVSSPGGSGAQIIEFTLTSVLCASHTGTGTGTGTANQISYVLALADPIGTICGGVIPPGPVRIYDDECCYLVGNVQLLVNSRGKAVKMQSSNRNTGCDQLIRPSCYWSIISFCGLGMNCGA
jgi:hypothetical protein